MLLVTFPEGLGGPQRWLEDLLRALGLEHAPSIDVWRPRGEFRGIAGKFRLLAMLRKQLQDKHHELVYLALNLDLAAQLTFLLRLMGCRKIIVHSHACGFCSDRPWLRGFYQAIVRRAWRKAAVSGPAACAMFGDNELHCVICPAFIDFRQLAQSAGESSATGRQPGYRFGFVGRFAPEKDPLFAIRAFAELVSRLPGASLIMVGDGPLLADSRRLANELGIENSIDFFGVTDRVGEIYRHRLDCLLVSSHYEGQCRVAAEAQFFGCQVVCTDILPEQAFLDPDAAIRLPVGDLEAWVAAMEQVAAQNLQGRRWTLEQAESHVLLGRKAGVNAFLRLVS